MEQMPNEEIDERMQMMAGYLNNIAIEKGIESANIVSSIDPNTNIITGRLYTPKDGDIAWAQMDLDKNITLLNKEEK